MKELRKSERTRFAVFLLRDGNESSSFLGGSEVILFPFLSFKDNKGVSLSVFPARLSKQTKTRSKFRQAVPVSKWFIMM